MAAASGPQPLGQSLQQPTGLDSRNRILAAVVNRRQTFERRADLQMITAGQTCDAILFGHTNHQLSAIST